MRVELDIFSGRSNPRWDLDEARTTELRELQAGLRQSREAALEPPSLGYRGFLYSDGTKTARVYRGYVTTESKVYADPLFSVERYLTQLIPAQFAVFRGRIVPPRP